MTALILLRRWWHVGAIAALLLALAGQQWRLDRARAATEQAETALTQQVADYRAAAEQARADAEQRRADAIAEQQRITDETATDYERRITDLRARYDSMREQAAADSSSAGVGNMPAIPDATCQPDAAALNRGFLEILQAADENTERLIGLQVWVRGQLLRGAQ